MQKPGASRSAKSGRSQRSRLVVRLADKIGKLRSGEALESARRHLHRSLLRRRSSIPLQPDSLIKAIDLGGFQSIRKRYSIPQPGAAWPKYFDLPTWFQENLDRISELDLDCGRRKRILDLGCGAGYFLFISKCLGHDVLGLDLDEVAMFREMMSLLELDRVVWQVRPFVPLPRLGKEFDLITAFMICFNGHKSRELWRPEEWKFFLDDLETQLSDSGRICLGLNREPDGSYYSKELRDYFTSRGAKLAKNRVLLRKARKIHSRQER